MFRFTKLIFTLTMLASLSSYAKDDSGWKDFKNISEKSCVGNIHFYPESCCLDFFYSTTPEVWSSVRFQGSKSNVGLNPGESMVGTLFAVLMLPLTAIPNISINHANCDEVKEAYDYIVKFPRCDNPDYK